MKITFWTHAVQRMFERSISVDDVRAVIQEGETIESYADDPVSPSRLLLGWIKKRPLHLVAVDNPADDEIIVITAYEPDPGRWQAGFKVRRET